MLGYSFIVQSRFKERPTSGPDCPKTPVDGCKPKENADDAWQLRNKLAGKEKSQYMSWKDRHVSSLDLTALGQIMSKWWI